MCSAVDCLHDSVTSTLDTGAMVLAYFDVCMSIRLEGLRYLDNGVYIPLAGTGTATGTATAKAAMESTVAITVVNFMVNLEV